MSTGHRASGKTQASGTRRRAPGKKNRASGIGRRALGKTMGFYNGQRKEQEVGLSPDKTNKDAGT